MNSMTHHDSGNGSGPLAMRGEVYHTDANTWTIIPEQAPPPPGVTGTDGEWSVLLDRNTNPATVAGYQKTPLKIVVKRV